MENLAIAFLGWLAWNVIIFAIDKDTVEDSGQQFSFHDYCKKQYEHWMATAVGVPIIMVGADLMDIVKVFHDTNITWSNAFYLGAGVVIEVPLYFIKKWRKQKQSE